LIEAKQVKAISSTEEEEDRDFVEGRVSMLVRGLRVRRPSHGRGYPTHSGIGIVPDPDYRVSQSYPHNVPQDKQERRLEGLHYWPMMLTKLEDCSSAIRQPTYQLPIMERLCSWYSDTTKPLGLVSRLSQPSGLSSQYLSWQVSLGVGVELCGRGRGCRTPAAAQLRRY